MDDKLRMEVLELLEQAEQASQPTADKIAFEEELKKENTEALIHSSTDRMPARPFTTELPNRTTVTHN